MFNIFKKRLNEEFEIIRLVAGQNYYPASLEGTGNDLSVFNGWLPDETLASINIDIYEDSIIHTKVDLPIGKSRYGGPIIDLPEGAEIPEGLEFAAHLNLSEFTHLDSYGLLPKSGHLIIFTDIRTNKGKVIYTDEPSQKLVRKFKEHTDNFYTGVVIEKFYKSKERWNDRFRKPEGNWEQENLKHLLNEEGLIWNEFAGSEVSKIYGIFTHCHYNKENIAEWLSNDNIVLLQIGEDDFNDTGVFSVTIKKKDLIEKNFDNCLYFWGQS